MSDKVLGMRRYNNKWNGPIPKALWLFYEGVQNVQNEKDNSATGWNAKIIGERENAGGDKETPIHLHTHSIYSLTT